jgi:hypothetical protein
MQSLFQGGAMNLLKKSALLLATVFLALVFFNCAAHAQSQNKTMGQVNFDGATDVEKTSGVWIDGQYVGYLKELKGSRQVFLLPGEHEISVRQSGYLDFNEKIVVAPGEAKTLAVKMERDTRVQFPAVTAEVRLSVKPRRAAVFVDGTFVGYVHEFGGLGRAMLVSPGKHEIKITLPGYKTFETAINLRANEKYELKTDLPKGSMEQEDALLKGFE